MHALEFFEDACELYALVSSHCTRDTSDYSCEHSLTMIEEKLNDSSLFPTKLTNAFPHHFKVIKLHGSWCCSF
jgi:hypothetical protein